jgi:hypothetical protein
MCKGIRWFMGAALVASLCVSSGCDAKQRDAVSAIAGKVTFQGKPVTTGKVSFSSVATGTGAIAILDETGTYRLATPIKVGEYQVAVLPPDPPSPMAMAQNAKLSVSPVPAKFRSAASSGLTTTVKPGQNTADFAL